MAETVDWREKKRFHCQLKKTHKVSSLGKVYPAGLEPPEWAK